MLNLRFYHFLTTLIVLTPARFNMSTGSDANQHGCDILESLPSTTHIYQYQGMQQFLDTCSLEYDRLDHDKTGEASDLVVFTNIDQSTFLKDFVYSSESVAIKSWTTYCSSKEIIVVKMATVEHSDTIHMFGKLLMDAIGLPRLQNALRGFPGAGLQSDDHQKRPDYGWGPLHRPLDKGEKWPSMVLEVAVTQRRKQLESDVNLWLKKTKGRVKIAITIEVSRRKREIRISKWTHDDNGELFCEREILIWKASWEDQKIHVTNGPLLIEFEKLFLRQCDSQGEKDIEIDDDNLRLLAEHIWAD